MKTIILAAGMGSRLMPLTAKKPKCMVELFGKPLLHRQIATLRAGGAEKIIVVGGYQSEQLEADFDELVLNSAFDSTNMVATLFCALEHFTGNEDLIISYGDIIFEPRVLAAVLECDAQIVTAVDQDWRKYWEIRLDNPLDDAESLILSDGTVSSSLGVSRTATTIFRDSILVLLKFELIRLGRSLPAGKT